MINVSYFWYKSSIFV